MAKADNILPFGKLSNPEKRDLALLITENRFRAN